MTPPDHAFVAEYATRQADVVRLRLLLAECPEGPRAAVTWELRHAEDAFAILEAEARERARQLAGCSDGTTAAGASPLASTVAPSLDPQGGTT